MTATGWSIQYIDQHMDLPTLEGFNRAWDRHPPAHVSLASGGGHSGGGQDAASDAEFESLMSQLPQMERRP